MKSTKGKQSKGWRRGRVLRHALECMTAPSAEGAKEDFASAEAGFRACGHDQRTEPVWRLCARPLETFAPCGDYSLKVAAALSAAVTIIYLQEIALNFQAEPSLKSQRPPNASRSSGERGLGGEALLSEKRPLPQNLLAGNRAQPSGGTKLESSAPAKRQPLFGREGSGGEALLSEKRPLPPKIFTEIRFFTCQNGKMIV